jgi:UDPglucose 6-dehydrogenase
MINLSIAGTGYVGLVVGACLAKKGHKVICYDIDAAKIALLQKGIVPFYEKDLEDLILTEKKAKRLFFSTEQEDLFNDSDLCFLALPAPFLAEEIKKLAPKIDKKFTFVVKSTTPIGFMKEIELFLKDYPHITLIANPEFLREGSAIHDFCHPSRIILGTCDGKKNETLQTLYSSFPLSQDQILWTDYSSAELIKSASNAMLASRLSFMSEIAALSEKAGANMQTVCKGIGYDPRIGKDYLQPGIGFGGSCLPKDLALLQDFAKSHELKVSLLEAISAVNEYQPLAFFQKIKDHFSPLGGLKGKQIALLGLSFKPGTDDLRNSPAISVLRLLVSEKASLKIFDPKVTKLPIEFIENAILSQDPYEALTHADALLILTDWPEFQTFDWKKIKTIMKSPIFFDGKNQFTSLEMTELGFSYLSPGTSFKIGAV